MEQRERKIRFFRQHSLETCGASCILMILNYYRRVQYPTDKQERKLYSLYRCRAFKGMLASGIAECLVKNRLDVGIYHSSDHYMDNRDGYYPESLYKAMLDEYIGTIGKIKAQVHIETGSDITPDWCREQLGKGKFLIVQCIVPGDADGMHDETLHWILLCGCDGKDFLACDPLSGKIRLTETEMKGYTDTPVGSICITVDGYEECE